MPETASLGLKLRSLVSWFFGLQILLLTGLYILLLSLFSPPRRFFPLIQGSARLILWVCGMKVQIQGLERIDPLKPYIYMGNHVNLFDSVIVVAYLPHYIVGVEKDTHFRWPFYGALIRRFGNIPISQQNTESAKQSLGLALKTLQSGTSIVILPEGTRTRTGRLGVFKKGGFHLAIDAGATIAPLTFCGAFALNQKGSWLIKPGTVELIFSEPIDASAYSKEQLPELLERVKGTIEANLA